MPLSENELGLIDNMLQGDRASLARLITLAECRHPSTPGILKSLTSKAENAYIIGVTGPPGAGKSTITNKLIQLYREAGKKIGVLAVDPSSPFSGGAILGDRIRMHDHALDDGVFIRSISTRGTHGGLARATKDIIKLMSAYGMDYVIVETVGVGQTELGIVGVADTVLVVLVPEAGDEVQTMKAGLMEIADIFVVNKADREGARLLSKEIQQIVSLKSGGCDWVMPVLLSSAIRDEGIDEIQERIEEHKAYLGESGGLEIKRERRREEEFSEIIKEVLENSVADVMRDEEVKEIFSRVREGELDPYEAARLVLAKIAAS
ncbi:MAG: methylmalonyl Co-A mutase-associated GTPase MeaB [Deltaproteobacteria bacterium]